MHIPDRSSFFSAHVLEIATSGFQFVDFQELLLTLPYCDLEAIWWWLGHGMACTVLDGSSFLSSSKPTTLSSESSVECSPKSSNWMVDNCWWNVARAVDHLNYWMVFSYVLHLFYYVLLFVRVQDTFFSIPSQLPGLSGSGAHSPGLPARGRNLRLHRGICWTPQMPRYRHGMGWYHLVSRYMMIYESQPIDGMLVSYMFVWNMICLIWYV